MFIVTWGTVLLVTALYIIYYERIMFAEEAFLRIRFGEFFEQWASATPAIIPRFSGWKPPSQEFSWRNVIRREYTGLFVMIEFIVPGLAFLVYILMRGMLARVVNHHKDCGGVVQSLTWGFVWATIYTGPLALAVWVVHKLAVRHG